MIDLWNNFIYYLLEKLDPRLFGAQRSGLWPRVRRTFLEENPECAVCGTKKDLEIHHRVPVHIDPRMELSADNLITLCSRDHLLFGHLGSYHSWNMDVEADAVGWRLKIDDRP